MEEGLKLWKVNPPGVTSLPYHQAVGKLLYITITTCPDIAYLIGYLSCLISAFDNTHWTAAKCVMWYLKGTCDLCIVYTQPLSLTPWDLVPEGYTDSDWAACPITQKSISGYVFMLASRPIMWMSKAQTVVTLSSTEAEYNVTSETFKQAIYMHKFFSALNTDISILIVICCNNQSTIRIAYQHKTTFHSRVKHYDIKLHHVCDTVTQGIISMDYITSKTNPADLLTKVLP
jgi:hypothetical protein